jgi:hypothetical protein
MLLSIFDACTGTLTMNRATTATIRDIENIFFMVCSPCIVVTFVFELFYSEDFMPFGAPDNDLKSAPAVTG